MEINLRHYDANGQDTGQSSNYTLPHIQNVAGDMLGYSNMQNWPLLPRDSLPRNSMTVLGNYMQSLNLQLNLLLPAIQRFGEVAQREGVLNDALERQRLMIMGQQLGRALERLSNSMRPCGNILRSIRVLP